MFCFHVYAYALSMASFSSKVHPCQAGDHHHRRVGGRRAARFRGASRARFESADRTMS